MNNLVSLYFDATHAVVNGPNVSKLTFIAEMSGPSSTRRVLWYIPNEVGFETNGRTIELTPEFVANVIVDQLRLETRPALQWGVDVLERMTKILISESEQRRLERRIVETYTAHV